ncbi:MAG TPA: ClpXP protease specificity-enhancing factor SspB [Stellaceae bacterium]|nr:ClpXP protease specificity-enhancing factor SspB [Stellaceae bacterium]
MAQDLFHYDKMVERALRGVIHDALSRVAQEGLRSAHHFYIGFATQAPGVTIPARLLARFPAEMTIVLQHQFWDLDVGDEAFSVSLSFDKQVERLTIPFVAIRSFADPSVEFALAFAEPAPAATNEGALPAVVEAKPEPSKKEPGQSGEVVTLDSFRKR